MLEETTDQLTHLEERRAFAEASLTSKENKSESKSSPK